MLRLTVPVCSQTIVVLLFTFLSAIALSQTPLPNQQGIYTCVDARGRKLTSDRPILECANREQLVLNPSGTLKRRISPPISPQEQRELESRDRATSEERARLSEERKRDQALLIRYPDKTTHDKERATALAQAAVTKEFALARIKDLMQQRDNMQREMEFFKKDPTKAPPALTLQIDEISQRIELQHQLIANQDMEINRIIRRLDDELVRLRSLWTPQSALIKPS